MNGHNRIVFNKRADSESLDLKADPYSKETIRIREDFLKRYGSEKKVLDLGCGQGEYSVLASLYCSSVIGVDFSEVLLNKAYRKIESGGITNLRLIQADVTYLPFKDNSFDLVFSFSTLYCIKELLPVLKEMQRVVRINGFAIFDLGNILSLNRILTLLCSDLEEFYLLPYQMKRLIKAADFDILEHRLYQLFPMYGGWWVPFSSEYWRKVFVHKIRGRTIDEIVSSLPILRVFSFRHFFVCKKSIKLDKESM